MILDKFLNSLVRIITILKSQNALTMKWVNVLETVETASDIYCTVRTFPCFSSYIVITAQPLMGRAKKCTKQGHSCSVLSVEVSLKRWRRQTFPSDDFVYSFLSLLWSCVRNNTERSTILASLIRLPAVLVLKTLKKLSELLFSSTFMQCKLLMPIGMPFSFLRLVHQANELKFTWVLSSVLESLFSPRISSYLWSKVWEHMNVNCLWLFLLVYTILGIWFFLI